MTKLIGIGGVSRSGKSTLAKQIQGHFASRKVLILSQDDFVKDEKEIPKIKDRTDWEHPDSIDLRSLLRTIDEVKKSHDLIIIEGLLAFYFPALDSLYAHRILLTISKETFLFRRQQETRWGPEPEWFWEHVWGSYLKYGQPSNIPIDTISGNKPIEVSQLVRLIKVLDQTNH